MLHKRYARLASLYFVATLVHQSAIIEANDQNGCAPINNLVPLYRVYKHSTGSHFYATNHDEAVNAILNLGYVSERIPGFVAVNSRDCRNRENAMKPVYRLYKEGGDNEDHFFTQNAAEAENASKNLGYVHEGIAFYCPSEPDCGAIWGLQRYWRGDRIAEHFYTEDIDEGNRNVVAQGGTHEGVLCYIWPRPSSVQ